MNLYDKVISLDPDKFEETIATTADHYRFLIYDKKSVLAILHSLRETPFFLREKPTPVASAIQFLNAVVSPRIQRSDLVFVLVAIQAVVGVRGLRARNTFKIFPDGIVQKEFRVYPINTIRQAEALEIAISAIFEPPQQEQANIQSCTNSLIKAFEIRTKAMELFRLHENGFSYAGAKKKLNMADREYATAYQMLTNLGYVKPRKIVRANCVSLTTANIDFIKGLLGQGSRSPADIVNNIIDEYRNRKI